MTKAIPDHCEEFRGKPGAGDEGGVLIEPGMFQSRPGFQWPPVHPTLSPKIATFTLRLLLFYIVNNGKLWIVRAQPPPQQSLSKEERKTVMKAMISGLLDNSLVYTDYDGVLKTKADFLASGKAVGHRPEQQVTESMKAHVYRDAAVVTGVYRVKR